MEIIVLGTGCPKCKTLQKMTQEAVDTLGIEATITKEEDIVKIMAYGIMSTPGLVVNNKVILSGRLPKEQELQELLQKQQD